MIVATLGILFVVSAAFGAASQSSDRGASSSARRLLDGRLARGEISPDEHRERRHVLSASIHRSPVGDSLDGVAMGGEAVGCFGGNSPRSITVRSPGNRSVGAG